MSTKKKCCRCGKSKKLEKFRVDSRRIDGRRGACGKCERESDKARYHDTYTDKDKRISRVLHAAKVRARKRNMPFTITMEDVAPQIEAGVCSLSGLQFSYAKSVRGRRNPYAPSIDRIDSSKGYTPDNIRVVCFGLNLMAADWGLEVFEYIACCYIKEQNRVANKKARGVSKKATKPRHRKKDGVVRKRGGKDTELRSGGAV